MSIKGDINTFSLPAISRMIHAEKKTGILTLSRVNHKTSFYFKHGIIVFIDADKPRNLLLGAILKKENLISEVELYESLTISRSMNKRLGSVLIESGLISLKKLVNILFYQFKEVVAGILTWEGGEFIYSDEMNSCAEDIPLEIDTVRLMAEALKWKEYRVLIPDDRVVFQIIDKENHNFFSSDGVLRVLLLINSKRDVSQIIAETGFSRQAVYTTLVRLLSQGVITSKRMEIRKGENSQPGMSTIIKFYLNLLNDMVRVIRKGVGEGKSLSMLAKSLNHPLCTDSFLNLFQPGADNRTNFLRIYNHVQGQRIKLKEKDVIKHFNHLVDNLIREEYLLLGFRTYKKNLNLIISSLRSARGDEKPLARAMIRFLDQNVKNL